MKKLILTIACLSVLAAGCRKLEQPNTREFTEEAYWRDAQDALDALTSCYENIYADGFYFGNEALSDNAFVSGTGFSSVSLIAGGSYDPRIRASVKNGATITAPSANATSWSSTSAAYRIWTKPSASGSWRKRGSSAHGLTSI